MWMLSNATSTAWISQDRRKGRQGENGDRSRTVRTGSGQLLSFVVVAQLLSSAWFRASHHPLAVTEIVASYGYPESAIVPIVIAECALVVLYLVPQTSVLAAIVMTGYLGGAVAAHLRIADTARAAIPLVVGILAWGGLYLRDSCIRQLVPFRRSA